MRWLLLAFVVVPSAEIYLLIEVGQRIGALATLGVIAVTAVVGASLTRAQGLRTLQRIGERMERGELPTAELIDGAMILVAGVLLLTPGFATDATGLALLLPPVRAVLRPLVMARIRAAIRRRTLQIVVDVHDPRGAGPPPPGVGPIIEGRARRVDDTSREPTDDTPDPPAA